MQKDKNDLKENLMTFPVSQKKSIHGSRRLAREKVLQILISHLISESDLSFLFNHIFFRDYNFGNMPEDNPGRLLRNDEIQELDADVAINWREDDVAFAKMLLNHFEENKEYAIEVLKTITENWDFERITIIDRTLIILAVTEFISFSEIPIKVSINEVIEISKHYSTDKSTQFINGVLDKFLTKLNEEGKINKTGRGLSLNKS